jgi:hypothetical protein
MTKKPRTYYTLLTRGNDSQPWAIHFGDYDRKVVIQERYDVSQGAIIARETKVIETLDDQASIDAGVAEANRRTIYFNTGRKYTIHGQRITATCRDNKIVTFYDHDRMIDGQFELGRHCSFNQIEVMHWYDSGNYKATMLSREDGLMKGGCNTVFTPTIAGRSYPDSEHAVRDYNI